MNNLNSSEEKVKAYLKLIFDRYGMKRYRLAKKIGVDRGTITRAYKKDPDILLGELAYQNLLDKILEHYDFTCDANGKTIVQEKGSSSQQLIQTEENPLLHFVGKHELKWAKSVGENVIKQAVVTISVDGLNSVATFQDKEEVVFGIVEYKDRVLHFRFFNQFETFYVILDVGNTFNKTVISHLSGFLVAVDARRHFLYSAYALFYAPESKDQAQIDAYFEYAFTQPFMKIDKRIKKILDFRIPLSKMELPQDNKLYNYCNKSFYLYSYEDEDSSSTTAYIGRLVLKIGEDTNQVQLMNVKEVETTADYSGYVTLENQLLVFRLHTTTKDKYLDMRFNIGKEKVYQYAIGSSLGVESTNALSNHTLILEYDSKREVANMQPCAITPEKVEYQTLNENIKQFFKFKENNYIKLSSQPILSDRHFQNFFKRQVAKKKIQKGRLDSANDFVFIGYPMDNISFDVSPPACKISDLLHTRRYKTHIENNAISSIKDPVKKQSESALRGLTQLEMANTFLLLFPSKVVSSALIEFGFALQLRKKIYVCYQNEADLPWLIRNLPAIYSDTVERIPYKDEAELLSSLAEYFPAK